MIEKYLDLIRSSCILAIFLIVLERVTRIIVEVLFSAEITRSFSDDMASLNLGVAYLICAFMFILGFMGIYIEKKK